MTSSSKKKSSSTSASAASASDSKPHGHDEVVDVGATAATATKATTPSKLITYLVPLLAGAAFGAVFQLSRVHEFSFIRGQLQFSRFLMLKMFLSAAATSILVLNVLLPAISKTAAHRVATWRKTMTESVAERRGIPALVIGAGMLGAGMAISGSCPGTVFAQLASGSIQARWILVGATLGGAVYPLIDMVPGWTRLLELGGVPSLQKKTLAQAFGASSHVNVAVPLAAAFLALVGTLEFISPWQSELLTLLPKAEAAFPVAIPPYAAGLVVGLLQLPLILLVNNHLGCSSSYMTALANLLGIISPSACNKVPLLKALKSNAWQCFLMAGVSLGAFLTSTASGAAFRSDAMISRGEALLGGAMLVIGARLAAGCTSGHGISGMGYLGINSFIAVAAMFGTGIATAMIFY